LPESELTKQRKILIDVLFPDNEGFFECLQICNSMAASSAGFAGIMAFLNFKDRFYLSNSDIIRNRESKRAYPTYRAAWEAVESGELKESP
jgi:hypothetical protein